MIPRKLDIGKV